jgi:hypothetical protein
METRTDVAMKFVKRAGAQGWASLAPNTAVPWLSVFPLSFCPPYFICFLYDLKPVLNETTLRHEQQSVSRTTPGALMPTIVLFIVAELSAV